VREIPGRELKWHLVSLRLNLDICKALQRMAPEGDVKRIIQETI